jgi:hypothetical protein
MLPLVVVAVDDGPGVMVGEVDSVAEALNVASAAPEGDG